MKTILVKETMYYRSMSRISKLAASVTLAAAIVGCNSESADKYLESAKQYIAKREYHSASIQLKNAVQKAPENGEARQLLGLTLSKEGQLEAAEIELRKALAAGRSADEVEPLLVRVLLQQGKAQAALDTFATTQAKTPEALAELGALAADANISLGRIDEARKVLDRAAAHAKDTRSVQLGIARLAAVEKRYEDSLKALEGLIAKNAADAEALVLKAEVLLISNRRDDAMVAYERAIAANPADARPYLTVVPVLLRQGDPKGARKYVDQLLEKSPRGVSAVYLNALVTYSERKLPAARDLVLNVLKSAPDHVPSLLLAGAIELDSSNFAQSESHFSRALQINPNLLAVRKTLVGLYIRTGDPDRATDELTKLQALRPNDPSLLALAGEVAIINGNFDDAARALEKAVAANPKDAASRVRLGQARFAAGNTEQGIEDLEQAVISDPSQVKAEASLVAIYVSKKEFAKALAAADALVKKQPDNPQAYNLRASVHLAKKNEGAGREDLEHALKLRPTFFPAARSLAALDLRKGDDASAKRRYDNVLAQDPKSVQALLGLAEIAARSKEGSSDALSYINKAIEANPKSPGARVTKVRFLNSRGDKKAALAAAQEAAVVMPDSASVLDSLAQAQLAAGDSNQALATFGKLASLLPKSVVPLAGQADAYVATKDWDGARRALRKALEIDKNSYPVHKALSQVSLFEGKPDQALAEIRDIQKQWPDRAENYVIEARILLSQNKPEEAERVLRSTYAKHPSTETTSALVSFLNAQSKQAEADVVAAQWLKQNPNDAAIPAAQGQARLAVKDYPGAAKWLRVALKARPDSALVLNNLAWTLNEMKDPSAIEVAEKAIALAPNSPEVIDTLGWIRVERGDVSKGIELLTRATALAPENPGIRLNLAKALLKAGRKSDAKSHLDTLLKLPKDSAPRKEAELLLSQS